jgi:hypothetical protein
MTDHATKHLDSRRLEDGSGREYYDYVVTLDDTEAVERSPFRYALEALGELGMTQVLIYHPTQNGPTDYNYSKWGVDGLKKVPGSEPMIAEELGGELTVAARIDEDGDRTLEFAFGAGDYKEFATEDLNELVWGSLTAIHAMLTSTRVGADIPILPASSAS